MVEELENIEAAVKDVETAVGKVETAVKDQWSTAQAVVGIFVLAGVWTIFDDIWHSKWRYALSNNAETDKVIVDNVPHDCAFIAAPLGEKYCHYDRVVSVVRWATSQLGSPIISYDDGKTWSQFTPDPSDVVPKTSTVQMVRISWEKKDE
jgi:hypothetical protein